MTNAGNSKIQAEEATNTSEPEVEQSTSGSKELAVETTDTTSADSIKEVTDSEKSTQLADIPKTPAAWPNLVKDTSNINIFNKNDKNTWTKPDFSNSWNLSNSTFEVFTNDGIVADRSSGNYGDEVSFTNLPMYIGTTAARKTFNTNFGIIIHNARYGKDLVDIKVTILTMTNGTVISSDAANFGKSVYLRLKPGTVQNVPSIRIFSSQMPLLSQRVGMEFFSAGTTTPFTVKTPIGFGDWEGNWDETTMSNGPGANGRSTINVFETAMLFNGTDTTSFQRYNFFGNWGTPISTIDPKSGRPLTIKMYKYKDGTTVWLPKDGRYADSADHWTNAYNLDNWNPKEAQFSIDYQGSAFQMGRVIGTIDTIGIGGVSGGDTETWSHGTYFGFPFAVPSQMVAPKKYVSDSDETLVTKDTLSDLHETFTYTFDAQFPTQSYLDYALKRWQISDTLPPGISLNGGVDAIKVVDAFDNTDLTSKFTSMIDGQNLIVKANADTLTDLSMYGEHSNLRITVPVRVTDASKITYDANGKVEIKNRFFLIGTYFTGEQVSLPSNDVITTTINSNALVVTKSVDKNYVELGEQKNDPIGLEETSNPITYRIRVKNSGKGKTVDKVIIRDALPYTEDLRSSIVDVNRRLKVMAVSLVDTATNTNVPSEIWFRNDNPDLTVDNITDNPSLYYDINMPDRGFRKDQNTLDGASLFVVKIPNIPPNTTYEFRIQAQVISPGLYANSASVGSVINQGLSTNTVHTMAMKRDLSGNVWFDANADGLKNNNEESAPNIAAKLYRTSTFDAGFVDQTVNNDLLGNLFMPDVIKTNAQGNYLFDYLPEGQYSASFSFDESKYQITKPLADSPAQDAINSKVDPKTKKVLEAPNTDIISDTWVNKSLTAPKLAELRNYTQFIYEPELENFEQRPFSQGIWVFRPSGPQLLLDYLDQITIPVGYKNNYGDPWLDIQFLVGRENIDATGIHSTDESILQFLNFDSGTARFSVKKAGTVEVVFPSKDGSYVYKKKVNVAPFSQAVWGYRPNGRPDYNLDQTEKMQLPRNYKNSGGGSWFDIFFKTGVSNINADGIHSTDNSIVEFLNFDGNIARFKPKKAGTTEIVFPSKDGTYTYKRKVTVVDYDGEHHMPNNNLGLVRTASLNLFKYEESSLIDSNHDGSYSDDELSKAEPVNGAQFEIYRGKLTDYPANGKQNADYVGEYTTDNAGKILVDKNLFLHQNADGSFSAQDYTLFEVKSPVGYELLKKPLYFNVSQANQTIRLVASDQKITELPSTGGKNAVPLMTILSIGAMTMALLLIAGYYLYRKSVMRGGHQNHVQH
ncbi:hypothetical protein RV18_GL003222 [Enterococcus termitis]|nr:hypothetical protein RV18_GL003222 [Enterococcus termitis]